MIREEALLEFRSKMEFAGIEFMLGHGTCLGVYRDNALIEDDHDIDILLFNKNTRDVAKAVPCEYRQTRHWRFNQYTFMFGGHKFDLSFWERSAETYIMRFKRYEPEVMPKKFGTPKPIAFLGRTFFIPKDTEEYLEYFYGKTWNKKINGKSARSRK